MNTAVVNVTDESEGIARLMSRTYDARAENYRSLWAPVLEGAGRRLLFALRSRANGHVISDVLDVGTGVGTLMPHLATSFPEASVTGVDTSPGMLALASPRFRRMVMDAADLALPGESIDLITAAFMLFYLIPPQTALAEMYRVLRPGGRLGTITWGPGTLETAADGVWRECLDEYGASTPTPLPSSAHELDTPAKMRALLRTVGFSDVGAWEEELVHAFDFQKFMALRTTMGPDIRRFHSLSAAEKSACITEARRRLRVLDPRAFEFRAVAVFAVGRRP